MSLIRELERQPVALMNRLAESDLSRDEDFRRAYADVREELRAARARMSAERWADVPGHEGRYRVSTLGRVRGPSGRVLYQERVELTGQGYAAGAGYMKVALWRENRRRWMYVHRLVLLAFVGEPPEGHEGSHLNDVSDDNRLENLAWESRGENMARVRRALERAEEERDEIINNYRRESNEGEVPF